MKRILMITGDAGEGLEIYYALFRLREEGYEVHVAGPTKKVLRAVVHDFEPGLDTYVERPGYGVPADVALGDVDPAKYDGLVLPGGRAPEYLRNMPAVIAITRHFFEHRKPVASNCHGVQILMAAQVAGGRTMTAYPELACDLRQAGARFVDEPVVVDENLVSVRTWGDNTPWMAEFIKLLDGK
jgi:protease I